MFLGGLGCETVEIDEWHPGLEGQYIAELAVQESTTCMPPYWFVEIIGVFKLSGACPLLLGGLITIECGGLTAKGG